MKSDTSGVRLRYSRRAQIGRKELNMHSNYDWLIHVVEDKDSFKIPGSHYVTLSLTQDEYEKLLHFCGRDRKRLQNARSKLHLFGKDNGNYLICCDDSIYEEFKIYDKENRSLQAIRARSERDGFDLDAYFLWEIPLCDPDKWVFCFFHTIDYAKVREHGYKSDVPFREINFDCEYHGDEIIVRPFNYEATGDAQFPATCQEAVIWNEPMLDPQRATDDTE